VSAATRNPASVPARTAWIASTILLLLMLATMLAAAARAAVPEADVDRLTGRILGETPTMNDLRELTDRIGGRVSGTAACDRAVDWAAAKFREASVDTVTLESFTLAEAWAPRTVEAQSLSPVAFPLRVAAAPGTASTPTGRQVEGHLVHAGEGSAETFAKLGETAKGGIALVRNPEMHSLEDLFAEYLKSGTILEAARKAGVAAVLLESSRPRGLLYRHPMTVNGTNDPMPVAVVAREQAERLFRLLDGGPVRVRIAIDNAIGVNVPSRNVVAEIRGSDKKEEIVLVGAHLDAWDLGTGANDNGVSCAEIIDLARQIVASGLKPRRTIRFVLFTGEEQGMLGSKAYVAKHDAELDKHVAAVIFDIGSGKLTGMYVNGREELRAPVDGALARVASLGPFASSTEGLDGTDNFYFLLAGVPNLVGMQDAGPYLPDYHAESDTFDKVDPRETKAAEAALAALVWDLANREARLGRRQSRAEVETLLKETHLDEQMKAFGQWDAWIATRPSAQR
jgi:carboxypeptidase Q